jgi:hypothetical protein
MYDMLKSLFPDTPIQSNFKLPTEEKALTMSHGLKYYELDVSFIVTLNLDDLSQVFLPQYSLALEYQGEQHYYSTHIFGKASDRQKTDKLKHNFANEMGITLLSIPYWWDKSPSSLAATIQYHRPDIVSRYTTVGAPIPAEMPLRFQRRFKYIPNAPKEFNDQVDPTGW